KLRMYSEHRRELREFDAAGVLELPPAREWTDYVIGVARELACAGYPIEGMKLLIRSTVPEGSGLSSSGALEVSTAMALPRGRRPGEALPARRAELRRNALRHHGPVHLGAWTCALGGGDRLPQSGTPACGLTGRGDLCRRQYDGEARAGGIGVSRSRRGVCC